MVKVHTRAKRRLGISTHLKGKNIIKKRSKPKAFKSEKKALDYINKNKLTKYEVVKLKEKKFKIRRI